MEELDNWKKQFIESIEKKDAKELYDLVLDCAEPDDYDGCFTLKGMWYFTTANSLFEKKYLSKIMNKI